MCLECYRGDSKIRFFVINVAVTISLVCFRPGFDTAGGTFGGYDVGRGRANFRRQNFRQRGRAGRGGYYEGYSQENFRSRRGRCVESRAISFHCQLG